MALGEKLMADDGQWLMGRVMPRELLQGIGKYLHRVTPKREDELIAAIKTRAEALIEANQDMAVDGPAKGMLAISVVVLAAFETLSPEFDGDERRTILYLQHVFGTVLRRTFEVTFGVLTSREDPLDTLDKACRKERPCYGSYFDIEFDRPEPGTFEMRVERCFFHDFFALHDAPLVTTVLCAWDTNWMGDRPGGQRIAIRAHLDDLAGRRHLPVPGPRDRRSHSRLQGRAGSAIHRRARIRLRASLLSERAAGVKAARKWDKWLGHRGWAPGATLLLALIRPTFWKAGVLRRSHPAA
jgi:hypothetical protein